MLAKIAYYMFARIAVYCTAVYTGQLYSRPLYPCVSRPIVVGRQLHASFPYPIDWPSVSFRMAPVALVCLQETDSPPSPELRPASEWH